MCGRESKGLKGRREDRDKGIMSYCDICIIEEKLYQCCGRHPLTGEYVKLEIANGKVFNACPNLNAQGLCAAYDLRPLGCKQFICEVYKKSEWIIDFSMKDF